MPDIHPTAIVEEGAELADDVHIGPYSIVGPQVKLESGVHLESHVVMAGNTHVGENTKFFPFTSIGQPPQDLKYKGEDVRLRIGKNNIIREYVTMNPGTGVGRGETVVGDDGLFMIGAHIAHDCIVGNNVIFANHATLGGYVTVDDFVMLGGLSGVHQHNRIGRYAFVGGGSTVVGDLIPYGSAYGVHANLEGLNIVGMKRRGLSRDTIHIIRSAYRLLFAREGTFQERIEDAIEQFGNTEEVMEIIDFIKQDSARAMCMPAFDGGR